MTCLVTSIAESTPAEMLARIEQAFAAGTDWVELRLDYLDPDVKPSEVADVLSNVRAGPWIATLRSADEGGACHAPAEARLAFLLEATANREGHVDFEHRAFKAEFCKNAHSGGRPARGHRWILSLHDFQNQPGDVSALARKMIAAGPDTIAKVTWWGRGLSDNIVAFQAMRALRDRVIAVVMGEAGLASRVLARKFGAAATYCALSAGAETAPGQITLDEMLHEYRWRAIGPATKVFGVFGDPVRHSLSPLLFNRLFDRGGIDAVYLPFPAAGGENELGAFLEHAERHDWLNACGFSVTLPHKQAARRFAQSRVEPLAARIGAVNTLVRRDGRFHGHNTDYAGALDALCHGLNCTRADLRGLTANVLGAGGVARAVVAGVTDCGCDVTVFNRTQTSAATLAKEFGCRSAPWESKARRGGRVVINCTPLGMSPHEADSPLPAAALGDRPLVFDTVYNPAETHLLREAKQAGCVTVDGVEMFVRQAAAQYQLWFGETANVQAMRDIVSQALVWRGNVVLIGYRGSGKTTVGRLLADRLGYVFVDTDALVVEHAGKTIAAIFAEDGEAAFRDLEAAAIADAWARSGIVLSAGGGAVLRDDNVRRLRDCGTVLWLAADARTLWSRIQADADSNTNRPALTERIGLDEVRQILSERGPRYEKCAHHRIDVTERTPAQVTDAAEDLLGRDERHA